MNHSSNYDDDFNFNLMSNSLQLSFELLTHDIAYLIVRIKKRILSTNENRIHCLFKIDPMLQI